ncbi:MAG: hydrogenase maturation nickel metallochaperone HypA [Synergistaceae bacterium]|nr:hydrogenase maturation nickel metallochaperone HypA [Synergistaceae bacterium]
MFEFLLTDSINRTVLALCKKGGWRRVRKILVKVGEMRRLNPELMTVIFAAISKNTPAEGAAMSVMIIPAVFQCKSCGRTGALPDPFKALCPSCESSDLKLISGMEFAIEVLEVEGN